MSLEIRKELPKLISLAKVQGHGQDHTEHSKGEKRDGNVVETIERKVSKIQIKVGEKTNTSLDLGTLV